MSRDRATVMDRYDRLERRAEELASLGLAAQPTAVHREAVSALTDMLTLAQRYSTGRAPAPLRAMVRTLHKLEPVLVDELSRVPSEEIALFMRELGNRVLRISDAALPADAPRPDGAELLDAVRQTDEAFPAPTVGDDAERAADHAGEDQSPPT